jgi:hypothetical protein
MAVKSPQRYTRFTMLLIPAGYAQVAFLFEYLEGAEPAITTIGMDFRTIASTQAGAVDACASAWVTEVLPNQSNVIRFLGCSARIGVTGGEPVTVLEPRSEQGSSTEAFVPRNTGVLWKKSTARGGRRGRGRMYVPGSLTEPGVDQAGNLAPTVFAGWSTIAQNLRTALLGIGGGPVLLHDDQVTVSYNSATGKPVTTTINPGPPDPITGLTADSRAATQRRRMRN